MYVKLVEALCAEHQINLIKVSDWFIKADVGFLDFFSIRGFVKGTSVSVMTTWLPLLNPVRRLPLLPNFDLRCSLVHMAFISSLLRFLCTVCKPTSWCLFPSCDYIAISYFVGWRQQKARWVGRTLQDRPRRKTPQGGGLQLRCCQGKGLISFLMKKELFA